MDMDRCSECGRVIDICRSECNFRCQFLVAYYSGSILPKFIYDENGNQVRNPCCFAGMKMGQEDKK